MSCQSAPGIRPCLISHPISAHQCSLSMPISVASSMP
ncbi:unnamed protein product, partial [Staurois parvus]